jgi:hypothetical protein
MDVTGILKVKSDTQQVSEKFKKRDFVITDNSSQYPQHISFQLVQDKCAIIDQYKVGDEIKVHFNLRGREWTSPQGELRYFNSLEAWRIEGGASASSGNKAEAITESSFTAASESDDLPF